VWTGPHASGIYNLRGNSTFTSELSPETLSRLSWADDTTSLVLSPAVREDEGSYSCAAFVDSRRIDLIVTGISLFLLSD